MPKVTHNNGHHLYPHMCHQGGDRSGMRLPHRFHSSRKGKAAAQPSKTQVVAKESVPQKKENTSY